MQTDVLTIYCKVITFQILEWIKLLEIRVRYGGEVLIAMIKELNWMDSINPCQEWDNVPSSFHATVTQIKVQEDMVLTFQI